MESFASNSLTRILISYIFSDNEDFLSFALEVQLSSIATTFTQLAENKSKAHTKIIVEKRVNCGVEGAVSIKEKNCYKHIPIATDNFVRVVGTKYPTNPIWKKATIKGNYYHGDHFKNTFA